MTRHSFAGGAPATTLTGNITSGAASATLAATTGWPNTSIGPFVVTVDRGTASEEKMLVSAYTSSSMTIMTRGYDGTTAVAHSNGATVELTIDATQFDLHDSVIAAVGTSTPSTSAVGDSAADGTALTAPAAGDHKHARESFGSPGNSAPGDAATNGAAATVSRSDHKHGRESLATIAAGVVDGTATDITISAVGDSQGAGSVGKPSDAGHRHGREAFGTSASVSAPGDAEAPGTAVTPSRSDHLHGREAATTDSGWIAVTFTSPWGNFGAGGTSCAYRKIGKVVRLRGLAVGGSSTQPVFTLPSGFQPTGSQVFPLGTNTATGAVATITSSGVVTPTFTGAPNFIALDSVSFTTD